jgi:hypothetical protein
VAFSVSAQKLTLNKLIQLHKQNLLGVDEYLTKQNWKGGITFHNLEGAFGCDEGNWESLLAGGVLTIKRNCECNNFTQYTYVGDDSEEWRNKVLKELQTSTVYIFNDITTEESPLGLVINYFYKNNGLVIALRFIPGTVITELYIVN